MVTRRSARVSTRLRHSEITVAIQTNSSEDEADKADCQSEEDDVDVASDDDSDAADYEEHQSWLIENPDDIIDYAVKHFTKIQQGRRGQAIAESVSVSDSVVSHSSSGAITRQRRSVFAESYNPEDEEDVEFAHIKKTPAQLERLWNSIKDLVIFRSLDEDQREQILNAMFEKRVVKGQVIIQQDDDGHHSYVIESGKFQAIRSGQNAFVYDNAGIFGELALLHNTKRTATIIALSDGILWALDRATFRRILRAEAFKKLKTYNDLLQSVPMFKGLTDNERMKVADALITRFYSSGDVIIKQGDIGDGMYFMEEGRVSAYKDRNDGKGNVIVGKLYKGQYFGELALLTHQPRRATVMADCAVKAAFLDKDSFERLLGKCIDIMNRGIVDYNLKDPDLVEHLSRSLSKMKSPNTDELAELEEA